jgi:hypothetical protein
MPVPDTRVPLAAAALLEELRGLATRHFARPPVMVCTDRRGRFEAGYARLAPANGGAYHVLGQRHGLGLAEKQRQLQKMATLIRDYARHPDADPDRIVRTPGWPDSVEITLT